MIEIILTCFFSSLYCFGWWIVTDDGMILEPVRNLAKKYLNEFIYKPLFGCPVCFASIHGGTAYYFIHGTEYIYFAVVTIAGINYILIRKYV